MLALLQTDFRSLAVSELCTELPKAWKFTVWRQCVQLQVQQVSAWQGEILDAHTNLKINKTTNKKMYLDTAKKKTSKEE